MLPADSHAPDKRLPYFTMLMERLEAGDEDFAQAFGRHVHWGWWEDPAQADGSLTDFAAASDRLLAKLLAYAALQDGQDVLDCGCGFGGTVATINQTISRAHLVGLNIDERQIARARRTVLPQRDNRVEFVVADACQLPFPDASFDRVLAVECIFHFPNRGRFMAHARRVLRPGGRLVLSDFLDNRPLEAMVPDAELQAIHDRIMAFFGPSAFVTLDGYRMLAAQAGLALVAVEDITPGTLPSYDVCSRLFGRLSEEAAWAIRTVGEQNRDLQRYVLLAFEKR